MDLIYSPNMNQVPPNTASCTDPSTGQTVYGYPALRYLGGVLSGDAVARISLAFGWQGAFIVLGAVTAFSSLAAAFFFVLQRRPATL